MSRSGMLASVHIHETTQVDLPDVLLLSCLKPVLAAHLADPIGWSHECGHWPAYLAASKGRRRRQWLRPPLTRGSHFLEGP